MTEPTSTICLSPAAGALHPLRVIDIQRTLLGSQVERREPVRRNSAGPTRVIPVRLNHSLTSQFLENGPRHVNLLQTVFIYFLPLLRQFPVEREVRTASGIISGIVS